jgi:thioredoxin-like negative regulator of GroEL
LETLPDLTSAEAVDVALAARGLVLDIYTQSCVICRRLEPMVAAVAVASGGAVRAHKLDAERYSEFAVRHDVRGVPTLLLFRDGGLIDRRSGFSTASALRDWIQREVA